MGEKPFEYIFSLFLKSTSIHGLKYLRQGSRIEKVIWSTALILAFAILIYLLEILWEIYQSNRTIISIEETHKPIWSAPFPAVTICSINKVSKSLYETIKLELPWSNSLATEYAAGISSLPLNSHIFNKSEEERILSLEDNCTNCHTYVPKLMKLVMQPIDDIFKECSWLGKKTPCSQLFTTSLTDSGFCYSFNYNAFQKLHGTADDEMFDMKALYTYGAGMTTGLNVVLYPDTNDYYFPTEKANGFKVLVHHHNNFPFVAAKGIVVSQGNFVLLPVIPQQTVTSQEVQILSQDTRRCILKNENFLRHFSEYSNENCVLECMINRMERVCGCVSFQFNIGGNVSNLCTLKQLFCLVHNRHLINSFNPEESENETNSSTAECDCPRSCSTLDYQLEISKATYEGGHRDDKFSEDFSLTWSDFIQVQIYFKEFYYVKYKRDLVFTWHDVTAQFGGIAGIFLGFSVISIFEIVHCFVAFLLIKWPFHIYITKKNEVQTLQYYP